jgi:hypothetical protein
MQFIAVRFFASVAGNGSLIAAAVTLLADLYFEQTRVRTGRRSQV